MRTSMHLNFSTFCVIWMLYPNTCHCRWISFSFASAFSALVEPNTINIVKNICRSFYKTKFYVNTNLYNKSESQLQFFYISFFLWVSRIITPKVPALNLNYFNSLPPICSEFVQNTHIFPFYCFLHNMLFNQI